MRFFLLFFLMPSICFGGDLTHGEIKFNYLDSNLLWEMTVENAVSPEKLKALPEQIFWNLRDKKSKRLAADVWFEAPKADLQKGQFKIEQPYVVYRVLPHQADLEFVVAADATTAFPKIIFSLPLGDYCKQPGTQFRFKDLSGKQKKCFELREGDLPRDPSP